MINKKYANKTINILIFEIIYKCVSIAYSICGCSGAAA